MFPLFWGIGAGSVYDSGRYITLAGTRLWLARVHLAFCSYHLAEVIHAGVEMIAWPIWCFYLFNTNPPVSSLASEMS